MSDRPGPMPQDADAFSIGAALLMRDLEDVVAGTVAELQALAQVMQTPPVTRTEVSAPLAEPREEATSVADESLAPQPSKPLPAPSVPGMAPVSALARSVAGEEAGTVAPRPLDRSEEPAPSTVALTLPPATEPEPMEVVVAHAPSSMPAMVPATSADPTSTPARVMPTEARGPTSRAERQEASPTYTRAVIPGVTIAVRSSATESLARPGEGDEERPLARGIGPASAPSESRSAVPPPSREQGATSGDVYLDGAKVGRWMADLLAREIGGPSRGVTGFDPRLTATWPGALQGNSR